MQEKSVVGIVKRALPALVSILTTHKNKSPERGSGFLAHPKGYIITNRHVAGEQGTYTVIRHDGTPLEAHLVASDPVSDISILKTEEGLPALTLAPTYIPELGETVIALGNAMGMFPNSVSVGVVSGLARHIVAENEEGKEGEDLRGLIQTDAAVNLGNSGGPLLNAEGNVIGILTAVIEGAQGIGFAIPVRTVTRDIASLDAHGSIIRPFIGIRYLTITPQLALHEKLPVSYGALIHDPHREGIIPKSPAAKAGIKENDIILAINGKTLTPSYALEELLEDVNPGDTIALEVLRNGKKKIIEIPLGSRAR
jgi:S1-C subfamily serine protease